MQEINHQTFDLKWTNDRWATARTNNVEKLHERWSKEPTRAEILDDPKLKDGHLVIMKKEILDQLLSSHDLLAKNYSNKMSQTKLLFQTVDLITALAPKNQNDGLEKALSLLASLKENLAIS